MSATRSHAARKPTKSSQTEHANLGLVDSGGLLAQLLLLLRPPLLDLQIAQQQHQQSAQRLRCVEGSRLNSPRASATSRRSQRVRWKRLGTPKATVYDVRTKEQAATRVKERRKDPHTFLLELAPVLVLALIVPASLVHRSLLVLVGLSEESTQGAGTQSPCTAQEAEDSANNHASKLDHECVRTLLFFFSTLPFWNVERHLSIKVNSDEQTCYTRRKWSARHALVKEGGHGQLASLVQSERGDVGRPVQQDLHCQHRAL